MLEIKPYCENCGKALPNESTEAMICTYECTFCKTCVDEILKNVCPNCGGGFEKRPIRPQEELAKRPASTKDNVKPMNKNRHQEYLERYEHVSPENR